LTPKIEERFPDFVNSRGILSFLIGFLGFDFYEVFLAMTFEESVFKECKANLPFEYLCEELFAFYFTFFI
jgi:hypothetical protein